MKSILKFAFVSALLVTPLFAAKTASVTIAQQVSVGSAQIAPGDYKVSWQGSGPAVKVSLTRSGSAPIVLDAKLSAGQKGGGDVLVASQNGAQVLQEIDLSNATLVFDQAAQK
jgi:hypothetical protein